MSGDSEDLFDPLKLEEIMSLVPETRKLKDLHPGLMLRPLNVNDYEKGYFKLLGQLTEVGSPSASDFRARFREMQGLVGTYWILVIEDVDAKMVVASSTLILEKKFIRGCSNRGAIEDVVVDRKYRNRRLATLLVKCLVELSKKLGCYKATLDARTGTGGFYTQAGFSRDRDNDPYLMRF